MVVGVVVLARAVKLTFATDVVVCIAAAGLFPIPRDILADPEEIVGPERVCGKALVFGIISTARSSVGSKRIVNFTNETIF